MGTTYYTTTRRPFYTSTRSYNTIIPEDIYYTTKIPTFDATTISPMIDTTPTNTSTTESICKLIMYDQTYFRGNSKEIMADTIDFKDINFDDAVASLKVEGNCCWTLLTDSNYKGNSMIVDGNGLYESGNDIKEIFYKASSARNKCF